MHYLFGTGTDPVVFGEVDPADCAGGVEEKFGGTRDVVTACSGAGMNEVITLDRRRIRVGENGKRQTTLLRHIERDVGWIDTDGDGANADCVDFSEMLLDTP